MFKDAIQGWINNMKNNLDRQEFGHWKMIRNGRGCFCGVGMLSATYWQAAEGLSFEEIVTKGKVVSPEIALNDNFLHWLGVEQSDKAKSFMAQMLVKISDNYESGRQYEGLIGYLEVNLLPNCIERPGQQAACDGEGLPLTGEAPAYTSAAELERLMRYAIPSQHVDNPNYMHPSERRSRQRGIYIDELMMAEFERADRERMRRSRGLRSEPLHQLERRFPGLRIERLTHNDDIRIRYSGGDRIDCQQILHELMHYMKAFVPYGPNIAARIETEVLQAIDRVEHCQQAGIDMLFNPDYGCKIHIRELVPARREPIRFLGMDVSLGLFSEAAPAPLEPQS